MCTYGTRYIMLFERNYLIMEKGTLKDMIEDTIKDLEQVEYKYYNAYDGNVYQVASYLYGRYGELPAELLDDKLLQDVSDFIKKQDTLYNEDINFYVEELKLPF